MKTKIHKFAINVPNPSEKLAEVMLSLKPASSKDISTAVVPELVKNKLHILKAGISLDGCGNVSKKSLKLTLKPFSSIHVYVNVESSLSKKQEVAGLHLVDTRKGKITGGVLLICTSKPLIESPVTVITSPNACSAVLAKGLYGIEVGKAVTKPQFRVVPSGKEIEMVAQITNPTANPLQNTRVYLEHLGGANAEFDPGIWNIGTLNKGEIFYATWKIRSKTWLRGYFEPSIVVSSQGSEPTRITDRILFASKDKDD